MTPVHVRRNEPQTAGGVVALIFEAADSREADVWRTPSEIGELLEDVELLYWFCVELVVDSRELDTLLPPSEGGMLREARWKILSGYPAMRLRVEGLRLENPLEVLLQVAEIAWHTGAGLLFTGALAKVFNLPARFQEGREAFWEHRLRADENKRKWLERKQAERRYKPPSLKEMWLPDEAAEILRERDEEP